MSALRGAPGACSRVCALPLFACLLLFQSTVSAQTNEPRALYTRSFVVDVPSQPLVTVSLTNAVGVACLTIEEDLPAPAMPLDISGGGIWAPAQHAIHWGPYFNTPTTNVTYRLTGPPGNYPVDGGCWMDGKWHFSAEVTTVTVLAPAVPGELPSPPQQVAAPAFEPASGANVPTNVTISCTTTNALIYYTLDGSLPTTNSSAYTGPVTLASASVLRARGFVNGWTPSAGSVAYYGPPAPPLNLQLNRSIGTNSPASPVVTFTVTPGTNAHCVAVIESLPPGLSASDISAGGNYVASDNTVRWGPFFGTNALTLSYQADGRPGTYPLRASWSVDGVGGEESTETSIVIPAAPANPNPVPMPPPQVATPVIATSPVSTTTFPASVAISCATTNALIYYTLDGSLPTTNSTAYTGPISLTSTSVVRARAFLNGWTPSASSVAYYGSLAPPVNAQVTRNVGTNSPTSPVVTFQVTPGTNASCVAVTESLSPGLGAADVSAGGNYDASNNVVRWGPFFGADAQTLSYQAVGRPGTYPVRASWSVDGVSGGEAAETTVIIASTATNSNSLPKPPPQVAAPLFSPVSGSGVPANVTISCTTTNALIYYMLDGSVPTTNSIPYSTPLSVASAVVLRARAFLNGWTPSAASVAYYGPLAPPANAQVAQTTDTTTPSSPVVTLQVTPGTNASCVAVTENLPLGLGATNVSAGGTYSATNNVVRWGPFFGTNALALSYQAVGAPGAYPVDVLWSVDGVTSQSQGVNVIIGRSGPLVQGVPAVGTIFAAGQVDRWTFFGEAGNQITAFVKTGSGSPPLNWAYMRLLDPLTNILDAANNTVAGQTVALTDVTLPQTGIYRIDVRAPDSQASATGDYQISVWNATPQVNTSTLVFNQQVNGRLANPYGVDDYDFSAVAGQQIRFHLVGMSAPGVAFDLRGPNGWVGFTNLTADSDLMTLPTSGGYTLEAHPTGGDSYDVAYACELDQTVQTDLALGTNFVGQLAGSGQPQLFRIVLTNGAPLRLFLNNSGLDNQLELYLKSGSAPTRGDFDYSSAGPGANQQITAPFAHAGTWYVLVYGDYVPTPGSFTVAASAGSIVLSDVTPDHQANNVPLNMTLTGAGFGPGTGVQLIGADGTGYGAGTVSVDSFTELTAVFAPDSLPAGTYSVLATGADGSSELTNALTMSAPGEPKLGLHLIMPSELGRHAVATLYVEYANTGTAPMPAPLLVLEGVGPTPAIRPVFTLDQSRVVQDYWSSSLPPGAANQVYILASGAQPGVLNPGEDFRVPVYYLGLQQPWDFSQNTVDMALGYRTADDTNAIDWSSQEEALRPSALDSNTWDVVYANLTAGLTNAGAYVTMLDGEARYLSQCGEQVVDLDKLWDFAAQRAEGYTLLPVLDSSVDASMPSPGVTLNFSRQFSSTIRARNSSGWFGYGWYTPWQDHLLVESNGDYVQLVGEAGSARVFTRDSRTSDYFSSAGDSSQLSAAWDGTYELRDPDGTVTHYLAHGQIDYTEDPNGNRVTAIYNSKNQLLSLTHTSGASLAFAYNGAGLVQSITDSAGRSVTYGYDPGNQYLLSATTSDNKVTSYTYDTNGVPAEEHALTSVTRGGVTRHFTYDDQGRLASTYVASSDELTSFSYDLGEVSVANALGTNHLYFDDRGLLAKTTDALGNTTARQYDDNFHLTGLTEPTGASQSFAWCDCGNPTRITDELGNTTTFQHDNPFMRMTSFTDARGNRTKYAYDSSGNLLTTTYANGSVAQLADYTSSGLPQESINRRNQSISYTYTALGQVRRQSFADGSYNEFDYDARGNLTNVAQYGASGADANTRYTYDYAADGDRLRRVDYPGGRWVAFTYDEFGRRQTISDSTGGTNTYIYDDAGRLWRLLDATNGVVVEYLYNPSGLMKRINKGNGTYTTYAYDANGNILHLVNYAPDGSVDSRFDYTYNSLARRLTMSTLDGDWTYAYDGTGQLIRAVFASSNPSISDQDLSYNYDAVGNRTSTAINGVTMSYVANDVNEYTSVGGTNYQYDADGNLTFDGMRTYTYDAQNRLVNVSGPEGVTQYEYDALSNRVATIVNGAETDYLSDPTGMGNVVAELDGAGRLVALDVQGLGLVARSRSAGGLAYYAFDALGSTVGLSDETGAATSKYAYGPLGDELGGAGSVGNPFRFEGREGVQTGPNGLVFMRR